MRRLNLAYPWSIVAIVGGVIVALLLLLGIGLLVAPEPTRQLLASAELAYEDAQEYGRGLLGQAGLLAAPAIRLTPTSASPGASVRVQGIKYPPNTAIQVLWDGSA